MATNEYMESTESLMGGGAGPGPQASARGGPPKWQIASLVFGLAIGAAVTLHAGRGGRPLAPLGTDGLTVLAADANEVEIPVIIRDLKEGHPDVQRSDDGLHKGLVAATLGSDRKPTYVGGVTIESKESFDQWYNDDASVNKKIPKMLKLTKNAAGKFEFDRAGYFPIDGEGWNDKIAHAGTHHNYYFTLEMHHIFKYHGGESFMFRGDDDLWVFIDGKLVIDLGGTHLALKDEVDLDTLGLEKEKEYNLDLFFAERKVFESNFRIETSIALNEEVSGSTDSGDDSQCCLIKAINFLCFDEKQWWTIWC